MAQMNYSTPPRSFSILSKLMILFGGFNQMFGWMFFFIGMIFFWLVAAGVFAIESHTEVSEKWWLFPLVSIFPLVGLGFILYSFRVNVKRLDLLENGLFARGKLVEKRATNTENNDQRVYEFTFSFQAHDGNTYQSKGKTHITHLLEDESEEKILYAKHDPSFSCLYDIIPFAPEMKPNGELKQVHLRHVGVLILPLLSLLLHGGIFLVRFL